MKFLKAFTLNSIVFSLCFFVYLGPKFHEITKDFEWTGVRVGEGDTIHYRTG